MPRDTVTVAESTSLPFRPDKAAESSSSSDLDPPGRVSPQTVSFSYKPPKAISFSYKPPQLVALSSLTETPKTPEHTRTNCEPVKANCEPVKTNCEPAKTNFGPATTNCDLAADNCDQATTNCNLASTNCKPPKAKSGPFRTNSRSRARKINSSPDDDVRAVSSPSPDDAFEESTCADRPRRDEYPDNDEVPPAHPVVKDPKLLERFLRRGRSESVCRLITNIYDSDESGWSSDEGSGSRDGSQIRGLGSRKGRSSSSNDLLPVKSRVVPPGPPVRRSTTDIVPPARRSAVSSRAFTCIRTANFTPFHISPN